MLVSVGMIQREYRYYSLDFKAPGVFLLSKMYRRRFIKRYPEKAVAFAKQKLPLIL